MKIPSFNVNGLWSRTRFERTGPTFLDVIIIFFVISLIWIVGSLGRDMGAAFSDNVQPQIDLAYSNLPYYAARSTLRMFIGYGFSLIFTLAIGYMAAHSQRARTLILPVCDILQSIPVLGFLSITVTGFMSLFPGSLFGVECAAIFAIFTGQVWNMIFGFYHSLVTLPRDLDEASAEFELNPWKKFKTLELPAGAISLIWNSMMSFGGGWFFVVQSEAIRVLKRDVYLPGIGSYMALATEKGDTKAAWYAVITMILVIVAIDQLIWRPLVAWSQKFRFEQVESDSGFQSWFLELGRQSWFIRDIVNTIMMKFGEAFDSVMNPALDKTQKTIRQNPTWRKALDKIGWVFFIAILASIAYEAIVLLRNIQTSLTLKDVAHIFQLGFLTMGRVFFVVIFATLIWTPIGVWIGFRPKVSRFAQPIALIAASFPVNMTYQFVVGLFVAFAVPMNWGSMLLLALGTQWYILFNVIAGAMSIPSDLKESAKVFDLRGWRYWRTLIIPAIFPFWVTGACTAAGGAWNASIVAEVVRWGGNRLAADGLGSFIAFVSDKEDYPALFCGLAVMSLFVVLLNRLVWRSLYDLAERKFRLE